MPTPKKQSKEGVTLTPRDPMPTAAAPTNGNRPAPQSGIPLTKGNQTNKAATPRRKTEPVNAEDLELERQIQALQSARKAIRRAAAPAGGKKEKPAPVIYTGPSEETALAVREELLPVIEAAGNLEKDLSITIGKIADASDDVLRDMNTAALNMQRYGFRVQLAVAYEAIRRASGEWSKYTRQNKQATGPERSIAYWQDKKARVVGTSTRNLTLRAQLHGVFFVEQGENAGDDKLPQVAAAANYLGSVEWLRAAKEGVKSVAKAREYLLRLAERKRANDADIQTGKDDVKPFLPEEGKKLVSAWKVEDGVSQTRTDERKVMNIDAMLEEVHKVRKILLDEARERNEDGTYNGVFPKEYFIYFDNAGEWVSSPEHPGGDVYVLSLRCERSVKKELITGKDGEEREKITAEIDIMPLFLGNTEQPGDYLDPDGEEVGI